MPKGKGYGMKDMAKPMSMKKAMMSQTMGVGKGEKPKSMMMKGMKGMKKGMMK